MSLLTSLRLSKPAKAGGSVPSPLSFEGHGGIRAQHREAELKSLTRREWWLWLSAFFVTTLAAVGFLLSHFQRFFLYREHFYQIRDDQARWGLMCLVLLFNGWMVYRQWSFRRSRKQLQQESVAAEDTPGGKEDPSGVDPVTGLYTRGAIEQQLGKEIARARRQNIALTLATLHLDDLERIRAKFGKTATDELAKEFARRLKEASRGSDIAARIGSDDFLLVLPKCTLGEAKKVLDRLGVVEIKASGQKMVLAYTSGWVDYQTGDLPADLLRRATDILQLYKNASNDVLSSSLVAS
jgi:diguanylate cyclase (GGDEF)-like protein